MWEIEHAFVLKLGIRAVQTAAETQLEMSSATSESLTGTEVSYLV